MSTTLFRDFATYVCKTFTSSFGTVTQIYLRKHLDLELLSVIQVLHPRIFLYQNEKYQE